MSIDLSPQHWSPGEKTLAERQQQSPAPPAARIVEGQSGLVSATLSPIAVRAGIEALRQGGTAADAAAVVALTQVTVALGSYVSFAGILRLTYYEAASAKVSSLNAGWNSYLGEDAPKTIPVSEMGAYSPGVQATAGAQGRKTLVPGFMAGIEAMHKRFGKLPFAQLLQPALWYAENGVALSPLLTAYFGMREKYLARTPEGRRFLQQAKAGAVFYQPDLAATLRGVAAEGAAYMYVGSWGKKFVHAVQAEGGKVSEEDMRRYQPLWEDPLSSTFSGCEVVVPGLSGMGGCQLLEALNLAEERKLDREDPYFKDWKVFRTLSAILAFAQRFNPSAASPAERITKEHARAVAPTIEPQQASEPRHSDAIVVIDQWGNVASLVHSINTVLWGTTGIVVEGIPIPDPAGFQQARLAAAKPGEKVPNDMTPVIVLKDRKPRLALAAIGSSLLPETARLLLGILGNQLDLKTAMEAPPLLYNFEPTAEKPRLIPAGAYSPDFLIKLQDAGVSIQERSKQQVQGIKGTAVLALIDQANGAKRSVETPATFGFAAAL